VKAFPLIARNQRVSTQWAERLIGLSHARGARPTAEGCLHSTLLGTGSAHADPTATGESQPGETPEVREYDVDCLLINRSARSPLAHYRTAATAVGDNHESAAKRGGEDEKRVREGDSQ